MLTTDEFDGLALDLGFADQDRMALLQEPKGNKAPRAPLARTQENPTCLGINWTEPLIRHRVLNTQTGRNLMRIAADA